jgi:hypothetical protein
MDRFTRRDENGKAWIGPGKGGMSPAERFAQYEESGIEPKEINRLQKAFALASRILDDRVSLCPQQFFDISWPECSGEDNKCGDRPMWECWQKYITEVVESEAVCRVCGCTQDDACAGGCSLAEDDLCRSCTPEEEEIDYDTTPPAAEEVTP